MTSNVFCTSRSIWYLLKLVNGAIHSTQKQFIVQIKHGCHQQNATLHDASRTHAWHLYI